MAQRLTVAGPRRPLHRRSGLHHPGTAVAGITRVDELGTARPFEAAAVAECWASGARPEPVASACSPQRRQRVPLGIVLVAGRAVGRPRRHQSRCTGWPNRPTGRFTIPVPPQTIPPDPAWRSSAPTGWRCGCRCREPDRHHLSRCPTVVDGGAPVVITADAAAAMRARGARAIAAGADSPEALPALVNGSATVTVDWDPEGGRPHRRHRRSAPPWPPR